MRKISTLYKKDPNNRSLVINEVNEEYSWVFDGQAFPTQKFDGTAAAIINGKLFKRYDAKGNKKAPLDAIPCQEKDPITGHQPFWVLCERDNPADKYFWEAFEKFEDKLLIFEEPLSGYTATGTYELCGEKINGNPEKLKGHVLIRHGDSIVRITDFSFEGLRDYLGKPENDIEGIVFHHRNDGRMCKIRKSDFGFKR